MSRLRDFVERVALHGAGGDPTYWQREARRALAKTSLCPPEIGCSSCDWYRKRYIDVPAKQFSFKGVPATFDYPKEKVMAEKTVKVDGIVLTRAQVEKAYAEINLPPKLEELVGGDIVEKEGSDKRYIVVSGTLAMNLTAALGFVQVGFVRITDGKETWTTPRRGLRKVGWLKGSGKPA